MAAHIGWVDDAQSILLCRIDNLRGPDAYVVLAGQIPLVMRRAGHRVDLILVLGPGAPLPRGALQEAAILLRILPPNFGICVAVGGHWLLTNRLSLWLAPRLLRRWRPLLAQRVRFAASPTQARDLILAERSRHPHP
ncbi:MAG: hypothetical protein GYB67_15690 [Chloroflexi bacterium]|nr:hypothetical protein [Chloroflexota bacterium]